MSDKMRVLIVDDEPEIGNLLKLFLEDDFEVVTFTDPRLACDEVTRVPFDLVVSDIKMPFLTGLDVVKHVKKVRPSTHVVLITGHAQTERDKADAKELGAAGVLFKPFGDPAKVVNYLNDVVSSGSGGSKSASSAASTTTTTAKVASAPEAFKGKPLLMIIDDEPDLIEVLGILLGDDYDLRLFSNPVEALARLDDEPFKLILTDLNMPQMAGKDVITAIRQKFSELPIVIMTGHAEAEREVVEAMKVGGTAILSKPFPDPTIVLEKIGKLIK